MIKLLGSCSSATSQPYLCLNLMAMGSCGWYLSCYLQEEKIEHRNGMGSKETKSLAWSLWKHRAGFKNCALIQKCSRRGTKSRAVACLLPWYPLFWLVCFSPVSDKKNLKALLWVQGGGGALSLKEKLQQVFLKLTVSISHLNSSQQHPSKPSKNRS